MCCKIESESSVGRSHRSGTASDSKERQDNNTSSHTTQDMRYITQAQCKRSFNFKLTQPQNKLDIV